LRNFGYTCEYESFSVGAEDFDMAMRRLLGDFDAFNITVPYKKDALAYLDETHGDALTCTAVNAVICSTRTGYNTDGIGFLEMLRYAGVEIKGKRALVLGGGGSGATSALALKNAGAKVAVYRRDRAELEELCARLGVQAESDPNRGGYDIVVNTTGVGMHDTVGKSPVTAQAFDGAEWAVDLIYTPKQSEFLRLANGRGVKILNGEAMLFYQAYFADCLYLNRTPNAEEATALYKKFLCE
jgi:shikimate dehydrogenase